MKMRRSMVGFTLIELVMVIAIIGLLAAMSLPKFIDLQGSAREAGAKAGLGSLRGVLATKYAESISVTSRRSVTKLVNDAALRFRRSR